MPKQWIGDGSRGSALRDTVRVVYFLERHRRYRAISRHVFGRIKAGEINALVPILNFAELLVQLYRIRDHQAARSLLTRLQTFRYLEILDLTADIGTEAARLRRECGLRTPMPSMPPPPWPARRMAF